MDIDDTLPLSYHPVGVLNLVCAIIETGIEDIRQGDPVAIRWLRSRDFDHWCHYLDLDVDAARAAIERQRGTPKYSEDDIRCCIDLYNRGMTWDRAIRQAFGYYSETIRLLVFRYANITGRG